MYSWLSFKSLWLKPWRTLSTILGIAIGSSLYLTVLVMNQSILVSYREGLESVTGRADLVVTPQGAPWMREDALDRLEKSPVIAHANPTVQTSAKISWRTHDGHEAKEDVIDFFGIDLLDKSAVQNASAQSDARAIVPDQLSFLNHPNSVILSRSFADRASLKLNETLRVATPRGMRKLVVRGIMPDQGLAKAYGGAVAVMDIDAARQMFSMKGQIHRIDLFLLPGVPAAKALAQLKPAFSSELKIEEPAERAEAFQNNFRSFQALVEFLGSAGLLIAWILVAGTLQVSVSERRNEIGMLRALGASQGQVVSIFLGETLILGAIGGAIGMLTAWALSHAMLGTVVQSLSAQALTKIPEPRLHFGLLQSTLFLAGTIIGSMSAGLVPAIRAMLVPPQLAMQGALATEKQEDDADSWVSKLFFLPITVQLAIQNIWRRARRASVTVLLLSTSLAFVVVIDVMTESFHDTLSAHFQKTFTPDLVIIGQGQGRADQRQTIHEDFRAQLRAVPGVKAAFGERLVPITYKGKDVSLRTYDDLGPESGYTILEVVDRPILETGIELYTSHDFTVLVSEAFKSRFGKDRGDSIELDTPNGPTKARIIGITADFTSSNGAIYTSRHWYRKLWNDPLLSGIGVMIRPGAKQEDVQTAIRTRFAQSKNIQVMSDREYTSMIMDLVDQATGYVKCLRWAALLIAMIILTNSFMVEIRERWKELGVLRAVGMSPSQIYVLLGSEALIKALMATGFALLLGVLAARFGLQFYIRSELGWVFHMCFPWRIPALCTILAALVSVVAVAGPARQAVSEEVGLILCEQ